MKNKTKYIILGCIVVISLVTISINQPVITQKKIYHNTTHHEKDINMVMDEAIKEFKNMTSKIYSVYYDENSSLEFELTYMKEQDYQEVIIVYLEFKTEFFSAPKEFGENHYFSDYAYIFGKNHNGTWEYMSGGYL